MGFANVTFELSLKPFTDTSPATREDVCTRLFRQWLALARHADGLSVLLWSADGSEILDYGGRFEDSFEWAKWQGVANPAHPYSGSDPGNASIHQLPRLYRREPAVFTYGWLRDLVSALKRIGKTVTGRPVRVGATFDPGPEFAVSDFKYRRHREICMGDTMGKGTMVCCYAELAGDARAYAGFPGGIPAGTPFGTFLGRQARHFLGDLGFDYLWLSNGFGSGLETWGLKGAIFDGEHFRPERCAEVRRKSLGFWRAFREECPDIPLETRGTNLSTGMDLSSDAVPLREIYRTVPGIMPPPNSPWAALNGDFGLELVGWMSHIAEVPGDRFPFRFYTHDPWFLNSPWLDRYQREPHDIALPLMVSRIDAGGAVRVPTDLEFLTADDSWGEMPDQVPNEVIPHILAARAWAPDQPGPLVWAYPFDEYHEWTFGEAPRLEDVFFGDWFLRGAVNQGLPLNTVVSTRAAASLLATRPGLFRGSVLVTPVPDSGSAWDAALARQVRAGGQVLLYGPLSRAGAWVPSALGLVSAPPLAGTFSLRLPEPWDSCAYGGELRHHALFCAGGMAEAPGPETPPGGARILARNEEGCRVAAASAPLAGGGRLAWVRGTVSCDPRQLGGHLLVPYDARDVFPAEMLMRWAAGAFGWRLRHEKLDAAQPAPMLCVARHRNAFTMAGYQADGTVALRLRAPQGVPLLSGTETVISDGLGRCPLPKAWLRECRVFVEQADGGPLSCRIRHSGFPGVTRRLEVTGLREAVLRFYPEPGTEERVVLTLGQGVPCLEAPRLAGQLRESAWGPCIEAAPVTGQVMISW
ncbi:MAG: hypothetical protein JXR77_08030 [Lentisphaeria bacterium]|nr:hypothetical protein [Lentisphaeria bacterium]